MSKKIFRFFLVLFIGCSLSILITTVLSYYSVKNTEKRIVEEQQLMFEQSKDIFEDVCVELQKYPLNDKRVSINLTHINSDAKATKFHNEGVEIIFFNDGVVECNDEFFKEFCESNEKLYSALKKLYDEGFVFFINYDNNIIEFRVITPEIQAKGIYVPWIDSYGIDSYFIYHIHEKSGYWEFFYRYLG